LQAHPFRVSTSSDGHELTTDSSARWLAVSSFDHLFEFTACEVGLRVRPLEGPRMTDLKTVSSVADILERESEPTIKDWLRRVNLVPALTEVPLSDLDRTGHLPKLYVDLICRLRLAPDAAPSISAAAAAHGKVRHSQGYTASMLIEESRVFQVATFGALNLHKSELDQGQLLSDVMVIADEVEEQLMTAVHNLLELEAKPTGAAA
jgi:hypothetical protein